jgi:hypothetical protein
MLKKSVSVLLLMALLAAALPCMAEGSFTGNAQLMYDAVRWNLNLPKQSMITRAEEYLVKLNKELALHALLMEVTLSPELEMQYGLGGRLLVIDLDTGEMIDYKNFDGNVMWPEGELTDKHTALHLLYNCYWAYLEGYNETIMSEHEFITPVAEEEIAAINAALTKLFIR